MATGLRRPHLGGTLFDQTLTAQHKHPSFSKPHFERAALPHGGSNTLSAPTAFQSIPQEFLAGAVSGVFCGLSWQLKKSLLLRVWLPPGYLIFELLIVQQGTKCTETPAVRRAVLTTWQCNTHSRALTHTLTAAAASARTCPTESHLCVAKQLAPCLATLKKACRIEVFLSIR